MLIGYARVSTQDQTLDLQTDALTQAGCEKIFTDTMSGAKAERPGLQEAMHHLRAGDTLVVWRLDRLGRTLKQLIATVTELSEHEIGFKSLQEHIDTTTSGGKLIFHIFGALAEFERKLLESGQTLDSKPHERAESWAAGRRCKCETPKKWRSPGNSTPTRPCQCSRIAPRSRSGDARCIGIYGRSAWRLAIG